MAKAKKQPTGEEPQKKTGAKTPTKKATAAKKQSKASTASAPPLIDTSLAAAAAAKMVANRDMLNSAKPEAGERAESSSFKQFKEGLNKPSSHGPASFLHSTAPQKKLNVPMGGRKQIGHNQTFGADVNRAGVPRRTGGG